FEKQFCGREGIEDVMVKYEEEVAQNSRDYDVWFDYLRLEESAGDFERIWDVYERAIAEDMDRTKQIYTQCLNLIPHKTFTFAKIWLAFAKFQIRQTDFPGFRKTLGTSIGLCPKDKLFRGYIDLELRLQEIDRMRTLYEKHLSCNPGNSAAWIRFAGVKRSVGDMERCRGIYEIAIGQQELGMPEILWKSYIDVEIEEEEYSRARGLYERLLERSEHVKVWIAYARFEYGNGENGEDPVERLGAVRGVFTRGYDTLRRRGQKADRAFLVETWREFEKAFGDAEGLKAVEGNIPRMVKKRRKVILEDGSGGAESGVWEEYNDYLFPDDETERPNLKLFEMAHAWKEKLKMGVLDSDEESDDEDEEEDGGEEQTEGSSSKRKRDNSESGSRSDNEEDDDKEELNPKYYGRINSASDSNRSTSSTETTQPIDTAKGSQPIYNIIEIAMDFRLYLLSMRGLPHLVSKASIALVPIFAWLWIASIVHLFKTSLTDPGYLPLNLVPMAAAPDPQPQPPPLQDVNTIIEVHPTQNPTSPTQFIASTTSTPAIDIPLNNRNQDQNLPANYPFINVESTPPVTRPIYQDSITVYVKEIPVQIKYCYTCQIWRPPRSSHCRSCNRCVENHDHHCPWTGTCIGKHNYRHFINFIMTTALLSLFVCLSSVFDLVLIMRDLVSTTGFNDASASLSALELNPVLPILIVMTGMFALALGGMFGYHVLISASNMTTHEDIRRKYSQETRNGTRRSTNPFDHGGWRQNLMWVLCRPAESSYDPAYRFETQVRLLQEDRRPVVSGPLGVTTATWRRSLLQGSGGASVGGGSGVARETGHE
ncbi:UNVERIFIED_CONTAM: Crooked neck-like protein 1, partial [Siphonaria sp. JEL0065]